MPADTIPARLFARAKATPDAVAWATRSPEGAWVPRSYANMTEEIRQVARALIALGFAPGDRLCILGFNRPEWIAFDVGAMVAGGAPAGIYSTCSPVEVQYILHHAEAPFVLVENAAQWEKVKQQREFLPSLRHVVTMRGCAVIDDPLVLSYEAFLAHAAKTPESAVDDRVAALKDDDLATLIYTSGTTGPPKAVMLSHRNLTWTASCAAKLGKLQADEISLSYLPLSHIAEQMFSIHVPITLGSAVYFAESMERLKENLTEVRPTVFFGVPRVWEKFYAGVSAKLKVATGLKPKLLAWSMGIGQSVNALRNEGKEPGFFLGLQYALASKLLTKVKAALGIDRVRLAVSGAAPIGKEVLEFFAKLDLTVLEVYGQSEGTGPTSFNAPGHARLGTVGPVLPDTEVKIAADGEIVVRGPHIFLGYFRDPVATAETLVDGWLHSGDLGAFDADGFLSIVGRKKDILITAGGKNIAPRNIEEALKKIDLVSEAVVIGDRRAYLTALLVLDPDAVALVGAGAVMAELQKGVDKVNEQFARVEHIRKFEVLPRALSIEGGELTPTLKIKRKVVNQNFSTQIESMYGAE